MAEAAAGAGGSHDAQHGAPRRRQVRVAVAGLATVAVGAALFAGWPELAQAQRATGPTFRDVVAGKDVGTAIWVDLAFVLSYAAFGAAAFALIRDAAHRGRADPAAAAGTVLVLVAAAADAVEDAFLALALAERGDTALASTWLGWMRAFGLAKWGLGGTAALVLAALVAGRVWRAAPEPGRPTDRPAAGPAWDPPTEGERRAGVCLSGGGVRSAAFALGALQALRRRGVLARASYLSAASGGGYLAAGWAVSHAAVVPGDDGSTHPERWAPGSPEERWFRDHSSYLVPNAAGGLAGVARLVAGVALNLAVLGLVLMAVARPVGWLIHRIHPELRAETIAVVRDAVGEVALAPGTVVPVATYASAAGPAVTRYEVRLVPAAGNAVCVDVAPYRRGQADACFPVEPARPGLVDLRAGRAAVARQPTVAVGPVAAAPCRLGCDQGGALAVAAQPRLALATEVVAGPAELRAAVTVDRQPRVASTRGLTGTGYPRFSWWMWELGGGLAAAGLAVALGATGVRLRPRREAVLRALARSLGAAGLVALAVTVALPWLAVWVPRTAASLFDVVPGAREGDAAGSGLERYLVPAAGFVATALAAARQFLAAGRSSAGTGPSRPWYGRAWDALARGRAQLKWYETSPSKVLLAVLLPLAAVTVFVFQVRDAAAQGWAGRQLGSSLARQYLPYALWPPEWLKVALALGLLGLLAVTVDAHAWSLYPFYKRRLASAYLVRRVGGRPAEVDYDVLLPFAADPGHPGWAGLPEPGAPADRPQPQLVLCCAVNLSEYGVAPPGRRAGSFTFSSTEIGGPLVGYRTPGDYWAALPRSRRRDLTVPSAMAISGAAFSPAMGKQNLGPIGSVLAVGNLRLGVWLPHPSRLHEGAPGSTGRREWWWRVRRPGWTWFVREVLNRYKLRRRYLYVSDGGHWDNLGLVELFRRGCTEVYCVSCAGDGPTSFGTIGEAIALAREELGVEVLLDPSPLRSSAGDPAPGGRQLRRGGAGAGPATFAPARTVTGTFTYTRSPGKPTGRLWYVEADLTANMPFDVHTFAEGEAEFPDDPTGDQVFNHRQFESYRRLGYHQAEVMGP